MLYEVITKNTQAGREADEILRACVHCGFCNATCPTYLLLGDELDGPRGRIYLRITSYNVCYTKLLRFFSARYARRR